MATRAAPASRATMPKLLLGPAGQRLVRDGAAATACGCRSAVRCRPPPRSCRRTRCGPTVPPRCGTGRRSAAAWRRGAAPSPNAAAAAARARRCTRRYSRLGVLTFGLGSVQLPLAALGAVHLQLRRSRRATPRRPRRAVARATRRGALHRRARRRRCRVPWPASSSPSSADQRGGPARLVLVGRGLDGQFVVAHRLALRGQPLTRGSQFRLAAASLLPQHCGPGRDVSPSRFAAASATLRCVSQSTIACWCAAAAASSSARAAPTSAPRPTVRSRRVRRLSARPAGPASPRRVVTRRAPRQWRRSRSRVTASCSAPLGPGRAPPRRRRHLPAASAAARTRWAASSLA